ncbi:hypothetical protein GGS23DRAFT_362489 [Durotheca rogersii]|uniref:uncharacterized protein n=1 Tax=Durotheca rogersii TaxID=419775 RepID=UPI00221E3D6A|nr:uncharacterized protein GGS23DRAFT_362489 [Durotheca rogersii]KAI5865961.1 hypothetical protein GGS23DRAFT_362489 [Durotheca rogersii]
MDHLDPQGFEKLAEWTASIPDYEAYIFRRFDRLSARNLQFLESELATLEEELQDEDQDARKHAGKAADAVTLRNWTKFEELAAREGTKESRRMKLGREINEKLKNYYEMLVLQSKIVAMGRPEKYQLSVVRKYFHGSDGIPEDELGNSQPRQPTGSKDVEKGADKGLEYDHSRLLAGPDESRLKNKKELLALNPPSEKDLITQMIRSHPGFLPKEISPDGKREYTNEKVIGRVAAILSVSLAIGLMLGAIFSLRAVQSDGGRIGLIVAFTVTFAVTVGILTDAKRAEVFASSAAYAAVLVVFVSGDLAGSSATGSA